MEGGNFILIDKDKLDLVLHQLADLKQIVSSGQVQATSKKEWMPLNDFLAEYGMSRSSWYDHYKDKIKHRNDGIKIWVHTPSMDSYLMDKAIN